MGNSFWCNRCDIENFELSSACADQFLHDDPNHQITSEKRWILKLRCLDDVHSKQKGLTEEAFNELLNKVEKRIHSKEIPVYCRNKQLLIECLSRNPTCMLNCEREIDEFIDCVDTLRVRRIKERIQQSMKKKKIDFDDLFNS